MRIRKSTLKKIIREAFDQKGYDDFTEKFKKQYQQDDGSYRGQPDDPSEAVESQTPSFMIKGERYTEDERRAHNRPGANGKPMDFVLYSTLNPKTGTPGSGSLTVPQGMSLEDFYAAGATEGFPDYYRKPETGADMNRAIKAAEERGDWDNRSQNEGTKLEDMPDSWRQILGDVLKDK